MLVLRAAALVAALFVAGCFGEPERGPVEIKFGRDTCDYCRMIISDPRFAAQIRGGEKHKAYKFDDIGDAVFFLDGQAWKGEESVEFFVMDMNDGKTWLDARTAYYLPNQTSPMAYGFGAVRDFGDGMLSYGQMTEKVLAGGSHSRCEPARAEKIAAGGDDG